MLKLCIVVCALTLLVGYVHGFRSGIVKIYGNQPSRLGGGVRRCVGDGGDCMTDSRCCNGYTCSYSFSGRGLNGKCKKASFGYDGKPCETHEECGRDHCCQRETIGYRGPTRHVCRYNPYRCSSSDLPAAVDPGYYRYYKWRTMRRRGRKRTMV